MTTSEYIDPSEATQIHVYQEGADRWAIHAVNDGGGYTEHNWNRDGHPDKTLTRERAVEMVPEFAAYAGLPAGLPVEIVPMRPTEVGPTPEQRLKTIAGKVAQLRHELLNAAHYFPAYRDCFENIEEACGLISKVECQLNAAVRKAESEFQKQ